MAVSACTRANLYKIGNANSVAGIPGNLWMYKHVVATKAEVTTAGFFATAGGTLNGSLNEGDLVGDGSLQSGDLILCNHSTGWSILEIASTAAAAAGTASFVTLVTS